MALITITGFPASGKSTRVAQIKTSIEAFLVDPTYAGPKLNVAVVSDDSLAIDRSVYDGLSVSSGPRSWA